MPHGPYIETTIHTAKCTPCGERNKAVLRRCTTCSWAICTPCYEQRDGDLRHGSDLQGSRQAQTSSTSAHTATVTSALASISNNPPTSIAIDSTGGTPASSAAQVAQNTPREVGTLSGPFKAPAHDESQIKVPQREPKIQIRSSLKGKGKIPATKASKTARPSRDDETIDDDDDDQYLPRPTRSGRATGRQTEEMAVDDTDSSLTELSDSLFPTGSPYRVRATRSTRTHPAAERTGWARVLATSNEGQTDQIASDPDSAMAREYRRRIAMAQDLGLANFPPANTLLDTREQSYDLRAETMNVQESGIRESLRLDRMMRNLPLDVVADMETGIQRIIPPARRAEAERGADTSGVAPPEGQASRSPAGRSSAISGDAQTQSIAERLYPTWYRCETQRFPPQASDIPSGRSSTAINHRAISAAHSPRAAGTISDVESLEARDSAITTVNRAGSAQEVIPSHSGRAAGAGGRARQPPSRQDVPVHSGSDAEGREGTHDAQLLPARSGAQDDRSSRSGNSDEMDEGW